jgi:hypothetical protein
MPLDRCISTSLPFPYPLPALLCKSQEALSPRKNFTIAHTVSPVDRRALFQRQETEEGRITSDFIHFSVTRSQSSRKREALKEVLLSKEKIMASYQNGNDDDDLDDAFMESDQNYREDRKVEGEEQAEGYEEEDDNYFEEDDFESYGEVVESKIRQSPIVKPKNSSISLVSGGGSGIHEKSEADAGPDGEDEGNIFDDDDGGGGTATEAGGEREEEIDFENQSMTLESYMEEFFKRKYENHNVKENENDPTPDAVDPTVSPSPILPPHLLP